MNLDSVSPMALDGYCYVISGYVRLAKMTCVTGARISIPAARG
jgi:hypothetical protein